MKLIMPARKVDLTELIRKITICFAVTSTMSNFDTCARPKKGNVAEQPGELKHKYVNNMRIGDQADDNFKQKA